MSTETQAQDLTGLQGALDRAQFAGIDQGKGEVAVVDQTVKKAKSKERIVGVSPRSGAPLKPGPGRPPGVKSRVLSVRDAILEAFDMAGGPAYLYKLSQGTSSDRAAFTNLVAKVLPTQIQQEVSGGIQIQLSWLGQRSIGTVTAQAAEQITQVVDLQKDEKGKYRIAEPTGEASTGGAGDGQADDPPTPLRSGGGGGG